MPWKQRGYEVKTYAALAETAFGDPRARAALQRFDRLQAAGKRPEILYSEVHGWLIRDPLEDPGFATAMES